MADIAYSGFDINRPFYNLDGLTFKGIYICRLFSNACTLFG